MDVRFGAFACKGWNAYGSFKLIGGINKGRPNDKDLENAREFAKRLMAGPFSTAMGSIRAIFNLRRGGLDEE